MRTLSCLAIAAALWVPMAAWAQDTPTTSTNSTETEEVATPPRIIPKVEFSFGGGAGIGGYLASFPTDPWLMHVGQSDDMKQDYMKFYPPKASLMPAGHAGFFVDFNFTEHWGLITGAELGLYFSRVSSDMLLNVTTNVVTGSGSAGSYKKELWIGSNLPGFLEKHRMFALQIPLMLKYMTPISPAGHQFYIAGGAKFSRGLLAQYAQQWDSGGQYTVFARTDYPAEGLPDYILTFNSGHIKIVPSENYGHLSGSTAVKEDTFLERDNWKKIQVPPFDVMASLDLGFRWNLGKGKGIYTGLYCDFGLLRPLSRWHGRKVLDFASKDIVYQTPYDANGDRPLVSLAHAERHSILAADAPDYATSDLLDSPANSDLAVFKNSNSMAATLHKMQAGIKIRFAFGRVGTRPRKVKEPKVEPVKDPEPPTVVPEDIQRTMIRLSNALFAFDKFDLNDEARAMLDEVVAWLRDNPELTVEIGGHTDDRGSDEYNQKLSENRAKAVYDYFVQHGVEASRLSYKGYGESQPIATNDTEEGRQANRRVELKLK